MPQTLTKLGIANAALTLIGQKNILSTDTTWVTTKEAVTVKAIWELARLTALRAVNWKFARTRIALVAATTGTPPVAITVTGWDYVWTYPTNKHFIRKIFIDTTSANPDPVEYFIFFDSTTELQYIATKEAAVYAETTDTSVGTTIDHYLIYDPLFTMAFACLIAALVAKPLTGKDGEMERMSKLYQQFIDRAILQNAREGKLDSTLKDESVLLTARG